MTTSRTTTLAAGAAVLGLAAPALGQTPLPLPSDAKFDVPAGKIEQTVTIDKVSGPKAIAGHTKTVQWLTSDRSHTIVTDVATGRVKAETVATPTEIQTYNADEGRTRVKRRRRAGGLPVSSFTFEAAVQRVYLEQGYVRVIGEKQVDGRRALITENIAGGRWRSDPADTRTVAVIDASPENVRATMTMAKDVRLVAPGKVQHTVVVRKVEGSRAVASHERDAAKNRTTGLPVSQTEVHELTELLPASAKAAKARLAMAEHRGAKIRRR